MVQLRELKWPKSCTVPRELPTYQHNCVLIFSISGRKKKEIPVEVISIDQIAEKEVVATFSIPTIHTLIE